MKKLKCVNGRCGNSLNGECAKQMVNISGNCSARIEPTHTPTYAEEQLNHAIEKENKNSPNWEEEYCKLKKENEELQKELKDIKHIYYNSDISEVKEDNEDYSVKITILEQEKKELEKANQGLAAESKERYQTIRKLQRLIEDNTENAILSNKIEDLERENDSLKLKTAVTEKLEIEINNLNVIIDGKDKRINELSNEILHTKAINGGLNDKLETIDDEYQEEMKELKSELIELKKYDNKGYMEQINITLNEKNEEIEQLKESNKSLTLIITQHANVIDGQAKEIKTLRKCIDIIENITK